MEHTFTDQELNDIAGMIGETETVTRDGYRYVFSIEPDDFGTIEHVNDCDGLGRLAWPTRNRYTGRDERPNDFDGSARKFGPTQSHDAIWWQPYRDDSRIYDSPDEVAFMRDLLEYGYVGCVVTVFAECECCHTDREVGIASLWGIESPLCGKGNADYLAEVFADLLSEIEITVD